MADFFSWNRIIENLPILISKFPITLEIVFISFIVGSLLAMLLASAQIKKIPFISQCIRIFISFERGTPMLVQMLVVYYALPLFLQGIFGFDTRRWNRLSFVIITFILNEGAFLAETYRAAILAVPKGQTEAALTCGLTEMQSFIRIILPQAVRIAIPPAGLNIIGIFQSTSLVFMIGVIDIIGMAQAIGTRTSHSFECYLIVAFLFVAVSQLLSLGFKKLSSSLNFHASPVTR